MDAGAVLRGDSLTSVIDHRLATFGQNTGLVLVQQSDVELADGTPAVRQVISSPAAPNGYVVFLFEIDGDIFKAHIFDADSAYLKVGENVIKSLRR